MMLLIVLRAQQASDEAKEEVKEAEKTPVEDAPDISGFDTDLLKK